MDDLRWALGFEPFFGGEGQFFVPTFAEAANEGFLQEFIYTHAVFAAQNFGASAYLPAVIVDGRHSSIVFQTYGV